MSGPEVLDEMKSLAKYGSPAALAFAVTDLAKDNARLRVLIKATATMSPEDGCLWCSSYPGPQHPGRGPFVVDLPDNNFTHREDCAAFTVDGKVR